MTTTRALVTVLAVSLAPPVLAQPVPSRDELVALAHGLETAAARVSVASPGFLGSPATRAYRVPGIGAVVVLGPRVLVGGPGPARLVLPLATPAVPRGVAASRADLERAILELRTSLERVPADRAVADTDLRALERRAEERLAAAARARAEAFQALAQAMSTMPATRRAALGPRATPVTPVRATPPGAGNEDVVARVRRVLGEALPAAAALAASLPATESMSVAVDFVAPGQWPGSAPQRTLVVRGRIDALRQAAAAGQPATALEVLEY